MTRRTKNDLKTDWRCTYILQTFSQVWEWYDGSIERIQDGYMRNRTFWNLNWAACGVISSEANKLGCARLRRGPDYIWLDFCAEFKIAPMLYIPGSNSNQHIFPSSSYSHLPLPWRPLPRRHHWSSRTRLLLHIMVFFLPTRSYNRESQPALLSYLRSNTGLAGLVISIWMPISV